MHESHSARVPESELDVRIDDLLAEEARLGLVAGPSEVSAETGNTAPALLEPPTAVLAPYDPFVKWLLSSPIEVVTSIHKTLPFEITPLFAQAYESEAIYERHGHFRSRGEAEFLRSEIESECEAVADLLSVARRERNGIEDTVLDLEDERDVSRERIALLESRIVKHLQDRDLAIAEKYTTEQQIADIELWKAQSTPDKRSSMFGFLKKTERRSSTTIYTTKDIEKLQKDIADTKLETALAKSELDTHYYRLRQLEKKCVALKLEIAQASALEDDLQASLAQLRHERRSSLEKLQQVSDFSTAAQKQASPRGQKKSLSPTVRSPRRTRMWA